MVLGQLGCGFTVARGVELECGMEQLPGSWWTACADNCSCAVLYGCTKVSFTATSSLMSEPSPRPSVVMNG